MARKKMTKAQKNAKKQAKLRLEFERMYRQAEAIFRERNLGRYTTFEKVLRESGVNPRAKTITERNIKALKKLQNVKGMYTGVYRSMSLKELLRNEEFARERQLATEEAKYRKQPDKVIRSALDQFNSLLTEYTPAMREYISAWAERYQMHVEIINTLRDILFGGSDNDKATLAAVIFNYFKTYGNIETEDLYERIPEAHYYIVGDFNNMLDEFE